MRSRLFIEVFSKILHKGSQVVFGNLSEAREKRLENAMGMLEVS